MVNFTAVRDSICLHYVRESAFFTVNVYGWASCLTHVKVEGRRAAGPRSCVARSRARGLAERSSLERAAVWLVAGGVATPTSWERKLVFNAYRIEYALNTYRHTHPIRIQYVACGIRILCVLGYVLHTHRGEYESDSYPHTYQDTDSIRIVANTYP